MNGPAADTDMAVRLSVEVTARKDSVRFVSDAVQLFLVGPAGLANDTAQGTRIRLAVMEAVTNVVRHAYPDDSSGPLQVALTLDGDRLSVVLTDKAPRFDPFARQDPSEIAIPDPEALATGGYGLGIIKSVMDEVSHRYEDGNELTLRIGIRRDGSA